MLWFQESRFAEDVMVPYLVPPLELSPGMYTLTGLKYAERRFITSSGILDAITGSKPKYGKIIEMYQWRHIYSRPISPSDNVSSDGNYQNIAYGTVLWPTFLKSSSGFTQADLAKDIPVRLCQVVEDYRVNSAFDVLGSIGGLLALLQGIHILLFGRPLFWGLLLGSKLITPFGLVGKLATKGFRQRLRKHYYPSSIQSAEDVRTAAYTQDTINITEFLLDYVLDVGPAAAPQPKPKAQDVELRSSDIELRQISQDQDQDLHHRRSSGVTVPLMTVERPNSQDVSRQDE
ncbi:hypothetical protein BDV93DRAFT_524467 [Ceratobasidium sp. AG-I]|nr:hypothetical protein BDV93DRAFT_524467 [Ceratobasidium sp. AG-I]